MPKDEGYGFESIGGRSGQAWGWQDWGVVAAYALIGVATVLLTTERSPIGVVAIVAGAIVLILAIGGRRRREGRRASPSGDGQ